MNKLQELIQEIEEQISKIDLPHLSEYEKGCLDGTQLILSNLKAIAESEQQSDAVEFGDWLLENAQFDTLDTWVLNVYPAYGRKKYTTQELYNKFKDETTKEN